MTIGLNGNRATDSSTDYHQAKVHNLKY